MLGIGAIGPIAPAQGQQNTAPAAFAPAGLSSLSEDRLLTELATRQLDTLLDRAFETGQTPEAKRKGIRALLSLGKLAAEPALAEADRRTRIASICADINAALASLDDPQLLMREASLLISQSAERDANALEYWGASPRLQASLQPVAQTVLDLLDRAIARIEADLKKSAGGIQQTDDPFARQYLELDQLLTTARFTRQMASYYLVLALDRSSQQRNDMIEASITALRQFDDAESTVQPIVRNRIAKLLIARGRNADINDARDLLSSVYTLKTQPPADLSQQYEARYFVAVAALTDRNAQGAIDAMNALLEWQSTNIPEDRSPGAEAALAVLKYRVSNLQADGAGGDARMQYRGEAVSALVALLEKQPGLRDAIYERTLDRLPPDADLKSLDPLALQAIMRQGEQAVHAEGKADVQTLQRALAASDELIARRGDAMVGEEDIAVAALLRGLLLQRLGRDDEAINALVTFATEHSGNANAGFALDRAMAILQPRLKDRAQDGQINELYGKVLAVAVNAPYNRLELAYAYGRFLQQQGRHREAIDAFAKVPRDSITALSADYQQIIAIRGLVAESALPDDERRQRFNQVRQLTQTIMQRSAEADVPADRRILGVQALLLCADIVNRDERNPADALKLLDGFEARAEPFDRKQELVADALFIRIDAYMGLSQHANAADELNTLLDLQPQGKGERILQELLQRIDTEFRANRVNPADANLRRLAGARAQLAARMATWAAASNEPRVRSAAPQYAFFAAQAAREAAALIEDDAQRQSALESLLKSYDQMPAGNPQDQVVVTMGRAAVLFDMGQYEKVQPIYAKLLNDRALGPAVTNQDGQLVDNELYWEAQYRLLRCIDEMAHQSPDKYGEALQNAKAALARLYIMDGDAVGGNNWRQQFEQLRLEWIPDVNITSENR